MNAMQAEIIRTERLTLLPLAVEHAEEMAKALSDPGLHAFIGGTPATPQALRTRYTKLVAGSTDPGVSWCNWVISLRDQSCLVGTVQATIVHHDDGHTADIAWIVGTSWQGEGIASEAARGLVGWLARQAVRTVSAHIHPDHNASAAVAAAAGLTPTNDWHDGEVRWHHTTHGEPDHGPDS
jgi:RimJ/RimL family protein N-acetyltransferase